jgi:3-oxoadipate enol-lactonase
VSRASALVPVSGGGSLWAGREGTGHPVVLLHGAGMDSRLWDAVRPRLAHRYTLIRYDARGLGRSTTPTEPFSDVDRVARVGLSMGGETSIDFALAHPRRVSALALIGTSVSGHAWPPSTELTAYATARRERDAARLAVLELSIWAAMGTAAPGGDLVAAMVAENAPRRIATEHLLTYPDQDAVARLDRIAAPTLVVHGDRDHPEIATIARRLVAAIPGARLAVVPDADHYLPLRAPAPLADLLLAHLP